MTLRSFWRLNRRRNPKFPFFFFAFRRRGRGRSRKKMARKFLGLLARSGAERDRGAEPPRNRSVRVSQKPPRAPRVRSRFAQRSVFLHSGKQSTNDKSLVLCLPECPCQESNLEWEIRSLQLYPFNYRGISNLPCRVFRLNPFGELLQIQHFFLFIQANYFMHDIDIKTIGTIY
jgi:hypothetical protein